MTKDDLLKKLFKNGDLIVCVEKTAISRKRIKNIFKFQNSANGKIFTSGYNVIASMHNVSLSVLSCFKDVSDINRCCDIRLANEKEKILYNKTLKDNCLI